MGNSDSKWNGQKRLHWKKARSHKICQCTVHTERCSIPFFHDVLATQILLCGKDQCRVQWKQGKVEMENVEMEQNWDVS